MKRIIFTVGLVLSTLSLSAMDWSEYEVLCYRNGTEPSYEEWEYLCTDGATDYGYDNKELEEFYKIISEEE